MRYAIFAVLLVASPAVAAPCAVNILRAPDDVREVVEDKLEDEAPCTVPLEVRIIPTDGGYYLLARDDRGRVHERTVPDAMAVAVLVTSWADDDGTIAPPGVVAERPVAVVAPILAEPPAPKWLTLDGFIGTDIPTQGGRIAIDLFATGAWAFGISASVSSSDYSIPFQTQSGIGTVDSTRDVKGTIYVSYAMTSGEWYLRPSLGVGVVMTTASATTMSYFNAYAPSPEDTSDVSPTIEASMMFGRTFGNRSWAFEVGPALTAYSQSFHLPDNIISGPTIEPAGPDIIVSRSDLEWTLLAGLRHRM